MYGVPCCSCCSSINFFEFIGKVTSLHLQHPKTVPKGSIFDLLKLHFLFLINLLRKNQFFTLYSTLSPLQITTGRTFQKIKKHLEGKHMNPFPANDHFHPPPNQKFHSTFNGAHGDCGPGQGWWRCRLSIGARD